jgi:anionic cell wall polymer biosynthesis LytR-Cps2A-Psr (LCP) family protein
MDVLKKALVCFTILSILILVCGCVNTQGNVQMPVKDVEKPENKENQNANEVESKKRKPINSKLL